MKELKTHPINLKREIEGHNQANCVLFRGCGILPKIDLFEEKYGLRGFSISPTCIIAGLAKSIGLDVIKTEGATGDYKTNIESKFQKAIEMFESGYGFGFVHIKAVDDTGHDKNLELKIKFIAEIDEKLKTIVDSFLGTENVLCITSDHSTPVLFGDHSCEPVPVSICKFNNMQFVDNVENYNEIDCARGYLGRIKGTDLIRMLLLLHNS